MNRRTEHAFTLIEVCAALAIIAAAVTVTMYVMSGSAWRLQRAERFRNENQQLANAVEFFLLHPPGRDIEQKYFPYEGIRAECRYEEVELPEGMETEIDSQRLVKMIVELYDEQGTLINQVSLDRIVGVER